MLRFVFCCWICLLNAPRPRSSRSTQTQHNRISFLPEMIVLRWHSGATATTTCANLPPARCSEAAASLKSVA
uniref:Putative secreted protein n=1 Tax=Anopheles darlingi TaxID=43151 RepID=A0A2M4DMM9_ANODA